MNKAIKKILSFILKSVGYAMELVFMVLLIIAFFIGTPYVQTRLAKWTAAYYSHKLKTEVTIESVVITGYDQAELNGFMLKDRRGDTLVYSPKLTGSLELLSLDDEFVILDHITANNTRLKLQVYEGDSVSNLQFVIDYFAKPDDSDPSNFRAKINKINLEDVHFSYHNWNENAIDYGIDFNHLEITELNGKIKNLRNAFGATTAEVYKLSFKEQSGFKLDKLTTSFLFNGSKLKFQQIDLRTPDSKLLADGLQFKFDEVSDFRNFVEEVEMKAAVNPSTIHLTDISYFAPQLKKYPQRLNIQGNLSGTVSDMGITELTAAINDDTYFKGDVYLEGLPNPDSLVFYTDIENLQTSAESLRSIDLKHFNIEPSQISSQLDDFGVITLNGTLSGNSKKQIANLKISSDHGSLVTETITIEEIDGNLYYDGSFQTSHIDIAEITGVPELGDITSSVVFEGSGTDLDNLELELESKFNGFTYNDYNYDEIIVDGIIHRKEFLGKIIIDDDHLQFAFNGDIDFNKRKPHFDFILDIEKADLAKLNLTDRTDASISGKINVLGDGFTLDDFDGNITMSNIAYYEDGTDYYFDDIVINSDKTKNYHDIAVRTEFVDVDLVGSYRIDQLDESLFNLGSSVFPSLFPPEETHEVVKEEIDLKITIKDLEILTDLFIPELEVAPYTVIGVSYESKDQLLEFYAQSDWINYGDIRLANLQIDTTHKYTMFDPFYTLDIYADSLYITPNTYIENFSYKSNFFYDNVNSTITWASPDSSDWGEIETDIYIASFDEMIFDLHPSEVYNKNLGLWSIPKDAIVKMDSSSFTLNNLTAQNGKQSLRIKGVVSENPDDRLSVMLSSFDLYNLNNLTVDTTVFYDGTVTAKGYVSNLYDVPIIDAYSLISDFSINEHLIGDVETATSWNALENRLEVTGEVNRKGLKTISIKKGYYYIKREQESLDFDLKFKSTSIEFANAYMPEGFTNLMGDITGGLTLSGTGKQPILEGGLYLNQAGITIDLLNTSYYASGDIKIEPDMILVNNMPVFDQLGSEAMLNGSFFHQNFNRYTYDFFAIFNEPFLALNTTYADNPLYYGTAFATGDFSIEYNEFKKMEIEVNAKSEKGTDITLPLYGSKDVQLQNFITFVLADTVEEEDYAINLEGVELNLSLDVTEDALIKLVFDDIVGDAMQGRGNGHLDFYIDQFYDFYMFGNYEVTEGSYLFTLRDVINKKFDVKPGGMISWYGDPYEADLNLTAVYELRTSLYDIMPPAQREQYRQKTIVEAEMNLTDDLFDPSISFDINLPRSDENARTIVNNLTSTETDMNRQIFALLLLNQFLPTEYGTGGTAVNGGAAIGSTTSEMLSNQLSNMLSKLSDDFDIGLNYQPGDDVSSQEMAVALSTQLLNDKLTISTNLGVSHQNTGENANTLIGDVDVEYKLNDEGNLSVHGFNRSNEFDITQQNGNFTQGVGVFYQESFRNFDELWCKLKNLFIDKSKECDNCDYSYKSYIDPVEMERQKCIKYKEMREKRLLQEKKAFEKRTEGVDEEVKAKAKKKYEAKVEKIKAKFKDKVDKDGDGYLDC